MGKIEKHKPNIMKRFGNPSFAVQLYAAGPPILLQCSFNFSPLRPMISIGAIHSVVLNPVASTMTSAGYVSPDEVVIVFLSTWEMESLTSSKFSRAVALA